MKKRLALFGTILILACTGCANLKFLWPGLNSEERAILEFNVEGITLGSMSSHLQKFPQIITAPPPAKGPAIFQVANPNPYISMAIFTYVDNRLRKVELRYFDNVATKTLTYAGGWSGIANYLEKYYGPPSDFGPAVKDASTLGLDPTKAQYNGVWYFPRAHRQANFIALATANGGSAAFTIQDTSPPKKKWNPFGWLTPKPRPMPTPDPTRPNPGFMP